MSPMRKPLATSAPRRAAKGEPQSQNESGPGCSLVALRGLLARTASELGGLTLPVIRCLTPASQVPR